VLLECDALALQPGDAVPEDASCVIINAPAFDLAASAADALVAFAEQGGNIIMMTTPDNAEMPNLMRVAAAFGVRGTSGGMLHEGNANKYVGASTVLKPTVNTEHLLTYTVYANDMHMVMPKAHGILRDAALPEGVTVTDLFNATDAYTVAADGKESDLGAVATGVIAENANTGAKLLWFASADAFSDTTLSAYGNGAAYYFAIGADMLNDKYTSTLTAIEGINVEETSLVVSELSFRVLGVLISLVIPIVLIGCGVVVWIRRRRR
jgi:ABC-2 type transport system permease protein